MYGTQVKDIARTIPAIVVTTLARNETDACEISLGQDSSLRSESQSYDSGRQIGQHMYLLDLLTASQRWYPMVSSMSQGSFGSRLALLVNSREG